MSTVLAPVARPIATPLPVVVSKAKAAVWLVVAALLALGVYYFIGVDEGMTSVFGKTLVVHEFVHDARHFLGFPCH